MRDDHPIARLLSASERNPFSSSSLQFTGHICSGHHVMVLPRSESSISKEDRESFLRALQIHGHSRVMKDKRTILNKYFSKPKTGKEVDKIIRCFQTFAKDYNPYRLGGDRGIGLTSMSSHALSKWHHVLPPPDPNVASGMAAALKQVSEKAEGFSPEARKVLKFLSSLMKTGERKESLDLPATLLLARLLIDLEEEVNATKEASHSLFVHISQSFWRFLQAKANSDAASTAKGGETTETSSETTAASDIDKQAASLDPFQLSVRLKLMERIDQIVADSMRLATELEQ